MKDSSLYDKLEETAKYLYVIEGECDPELYQAIATLRQLINEEFSPKKSLSSQFIYDIINPAHQTLITKREREARIDELERAGRKSNVNNSYIPYYIENRIEELNTSEGGEVDGTNLQ